MNALPSNVVAYSISSLLYCCYRECKGLVLGPGMNVVPSTLGGYRITSSLLCCHIECSVLYLVQV